MSEAVGIVDFGGQYAHLISRRLRELGFRTIIIPYVSYNEELIEKERVKALILSGGPRSVDEEPEFLEVAKKVINRCEAGMPVMGICFGHQLLAYTLGCPIKKTKSSEFGETKVKVLRRDFIFEDIPQEFTAWMSHNDSIEKEDCEISVLAVSENGVIAAYRLEEIPLYGTQFHPEVEHTEYGRTMLDNFLRRVAKVSPSWRPTEVIEKKIEEIKSAHTHGNALVAVSGGVDSLTTAVILLRAFGPERIHVVFIDTGLMREKEAESVRQVLEGLGFRHIHIVDASSRFLSALRHVVDPEEKRQIIAATFKEVFSDVIRELEARYGRFSVFGQGTIYPDRIESGSVGTGSSKIKSHHNVVMGILEGVTVIEPLAEFYKDEVRAIARQLGLPDEIISRHPFPGPGLAIRIVGEVDDEKLRIVRKATEIVEEILREEGLYERVWQAFPVLLSEKAVGVRGDKRAYGYMLALRVVESTDAMTARFSRLPWDVVAKISSRLLNELPEVSRVLYDITNKPPGTIEFE